ncbi:MAG: hypothetical protein ACYC0C_16930 [Devosia sp.]
MTETPKWPPHREGPYRQILQHGGFSPRLRKGQTIIFDPTRAPRVGDVVAIWANDVPDSECVIGVLGRLTATTGAVELNASGSRAMAFRLRGVSVDPVQRFATDHELGEG